VFERAVILAALLLALPADGLEIVDPTRPQDGARDGERPLLLQSVLVSETRRVAVINGRTLQVGDRVDGARVTRIEPGSVWLQRDGDITRLDLVAATIRNSTERER
jgi:MSHA biogenesis protein MshK